MILSSLVILGRPLKKAGESFVFQLKQANLTVNLSKSGFVKAKVIYLGHVVGHGVVTPIKAKVTSIIAYPIPEIRKVE